MTDYKKQSLYFPARIIEEIRAEAFRLDRSLSWIMQFVWLHGREKLRQLPTVDRVIP